MLASPLAARAAPADAGELRIAIRSDLPGTEPGVSRSAIADDVLLHVVEGLVAYDERLRPVPMLAASIETSTDGRHYTFVLRDDVRFHNGAPLTAAEVAWTWRRMTGPGSRWLCRNWYDGSDGPRVERVVVVDSRTVRFELEAPSAIFLTRLANVQCLFAVLHPDSLDASGAWRAPVGTGPYRIAEWRRGRDLLLERFDDYAPLAGPADGLAGGKRPAVARVRWVVIPDGAAIKAALRSRQVDVGYLLDAADALELESATGIRLHTSPSLEKNVLLFGRTGLLADVRFRKAIALSLDREAIAIGASGAGRTARVLGVPNPSFVAAVSPYHSAAHERSLPVDVVAARSLLREAGYRGEVLKLQTNRRYANMFDNAILAQALLKRAGINVELEVVEWATQLDNYYHGRFQLMSFGYSGRTDPVLEYLAIVGDRQRFAYVQWDDPEARALVERASVDTAATARQAAFDRLHELMVEQVPLLTLYDHYVLDATGPRVGGYRAWPAAKPRLWMVTLSEAAGG